MTKSKLSPYFYFLIFQALLLVGVSIPTGLSLQQWQKDGVKKIKISENKPIRNGRLYFNQTSASTLDLMLDTGGNIIADLDLTILYSADRLNVGEINFSNSLCSIITKQKLDPHFGSLTIACTTERKSSQSQLSPIAHLTFQALQKGRAQFLIDPKNFMLNTVSGELRTAPAFISLNLLTSQNGLVQLPLYSQTHPRSSRCSTEKSAEFSWFYPDATTQFEYELNSSPTEMNKPLTTMAQAISLAPLPGTIQYFHLRSRSGNSTSQISSYPISSCAN